MYACKNSEPQGPEENVRLELLKTGHAAYYAQVVIAAVVIAPPGQNQYQHAYNEGGPDRVA